jgi:hypothetical protein
MCNKTRNYSPILGLVEEAQSMANRMEAGLAGKSDYEFWQGKAKKERDNMKALLKRTNKLRKKQGKEPDGMPFN